MSQQRAGLSGASHRRRRPVPTGRVVAGMVLAVAALVGIITLANALRPPFTAENPPSPQQRAALGDDPRDEPDCPQPAPREDRARVRGEASGSNRAVTVRSVVLYNCPEAFDGGRVRLRGEVVGGILRREGGAWIQLNDGVYADRFGPLPTHHVYAGSNDSIGVFISRRLANQISIVGGPRTRGDVLTITGTFHRVDDPTAEVAVVRARSGQVVQPGERLRQPLLWDRVVAAGMLTGLAVAVVGLERWFARRRRRSPG